MPLVYIPAAYERLTERFTLVDGAFPSGDGQIAITPKTAAPLAA